MFFLNNSVKPYNDESLYSLIFRLAIANHYLDFHSFCSGLFNNARLTIYRKNCNYLSNEFEWEVAFKKVLQSLGMDINKFVLNQFDGLLFKTGDHSSLNPDQIFQKSRTKYCPTCLEENHYHRLYWDINYFTICPYHHVKLIDKCDKCLRPNTLYEIMNRKCTCGENIPIIKQSIEIKESKLLASQINTFELLFKPATNLKIEWDFPLSSDVFFSQYLTYFLILYTLPSYEQFKPFTNFYFDPLPETPTTGKLVRSVESLIFINQLIFNLITRPSVYLKDFLVIFFEIHGGLSKKVKTKPYYRKLKMMGHMINNSQNLLEIVSSEEIIKYYYSTSILAKNKDKNTLMTFIEASSYLNMNGRTLTKLCSQGQLEMIKVKREQSKITFITKSSIEQYLNYHNNLFNLRETSEYLGVPTKNVEVLMRYKLLVPLPKMTGRTGEHLFKKTMIWDFEKSLIVNSELNNEINDPDWINLKKATKLLNIYVNFAEFLSLVRTKNFSTKLLKGTPVLQGLFFNELEIRNFLDMKKNEYAQIHGYTLCHVSDLLCIDYSRLKNLIKKNNIDVFTQITRRGISSISINEKGLSAIKKIINEESD